MSSIIGYLSPDINEHSTQLQLEKLKAAGASNIIQEKPAHTKRTRPQLDKLMTTVKEGDTLVVTSLDRIAHNAKHLYEIINTLTAIGVSFKVVDSGIDTSSSNGKNLQMLLGVILDFEQQVTKERQAIGIAKAKREGRYKGRKPTARAKSDEVMAFNEQGLTRQKIADELGIGIASVYRILQANSEPKKSRKKATKKPEKAVNRQKQVERKPTHKTDDEQLSFF